MARAPLVPGFSSTVAVIVLLGVANVTVITLVDWTLLLYMNHIAFTTMTSATFYVRVAAVSLIVPIFANIILGTLSTRFGTGRVHASGNLVVAIGLSAVVIFRESRLIFVIAYTVYALAFSFRVLRISMLTDVVSRKHRTSVMGAHQLCIPIGMIFGPLMWLGMQKWRGSFLLPFGIVADRFTANFALCIIIMLGCFIIAMKYLGDLSEENEAIAAEELIAGEEESARERAALLETSNDREHNAAHHEEDHFSGYGSVAGAQVNTRANSDGKILDVQCSDGKTLQVSLATYKWKRFCFYSVVMLGVRVSTMMYAVAFQPVLIDVFRVSEERISQLYLLVAFLALIPPALVAGLSHVWSDRAILVIALTLKTVGIVLTLPIFGPVTEWRFVCGFILIAKASMFFVPAVLSLFTKVLGRMCTAELIGSLWSVASMGPAVVQLALSDDIVEWFGGWAFGIFGLPAVMVFVILLSPYGWGMIDQNAELSRLVVREVDRRKVGSKGVKT